LDPISQTWEYVFCLVAIVFFFFHVFHLFMLKSSEKLIRQCQKTNFAFQAVLLFSRIYQDYIWVHVLLLRFWLKQGILIIILFFLEPSFYMVHTYDDAV